MIGKILTLISLVFRFHLKKILFLIASIIFGFVMQFPYDDLSDFITLQVTKLTQSGIYLQFDGLSFGLMPQLGIKMENVVIESMYAPTLAVKTLGFAPKISSLLTGKPGGKLKAYGLFNGDASVSFSNTKTSSGDNEALALDVQLESVQLKELSKYLKETYQFPVRMTGQTEFNTQLTVDPLFKDQPKGEVRLNIKQLNIPSSNIPVADFGMSLPLPALKLSELVLVGKMGDRKFLIQEGKIGDIKNDLHGQITGEIYLDFQAGGRVIPGGYNLKINLNISENLKRQLGPILGFVDIYQGIGQKYKFDSLQGIRYSMRLRANSLNAPPLVSAD